MYYFCPHDCGGNRIQVILIYIYHFCVRCPAAKSGILFYGNNIAVGSNAFMKMQSAMAVELLEINHIAIFKNYSKEMKKVQ